MRVFIEVEALDAGGQNIGLLIALFQRRRLLQILPDS
jgi:hypothetical protein